MTPPPNPCDDAQRWLLLRSVKSVALPRQALDARESWMVAARLLPEVADLAAKNPRAGRILDEVDALLRGGSGKEIAAATQR